MEDLFHIRDKGFDGFLKELDAKPIGHDKIDKEVLKLIYTQGFIDACKHLTLTIGARVDKLERKL